MPGFILQPFAAIKLLAFSGLVVTTAWAQSPLDAPGEKKVTVKTEISRGAREVLAHSREDGSLNLATLDEEMATVVSRNNAANTDSQGFLLGARFLQWYLLDMFLHHKYTRSKTTRRKSCDLGRLALKNTFPTCAGCRKS